MSVFGRIICYSKPYWGRIAISTVASIALGAMDGAVAYLVAPLLQKIFASKDLTIFTLLPFLVFGIFLIRAFCRFLNDYFIRTAGELAMLQVRNDIYANCMRLGLRYFHNQSTGSLMSRVLNDVAVMQSGIASVVTSLCRDGVSAISLLVVIFYRNWQLALISFVVIPLTVYAASKIGKRIKRVSIQTQEKMGDLVGILQESFSGIKVIKSFSLEQREVARFRSAASNYYHFLQKAIKYSSISAPVTEILSSIGIVAVLLTGGTMVLHGTMSSTDFFSFLTALILVYKPIKSLNGSYNSIQASVGAASRVFEIIDQEPEIVDDADAVTMERSRGEVEMRAVSFAYGDDYVLRDISLAAKTGEIIAFVGPSGGGKTTLVSLLSRFFEVSSGAIFIDGIDLRKITLASHMKQVALVDQEVTLFNDTIANNIRYGDPAATDEQVIAAATAAYAHDFITAMPSGYETNIGDRGVRLSGGQRQRICIARAILKDAPILILDEATSALDTESEQMVQNALNNLMTNRTTFVIAHRLSTILHADTIVVLEHGRIVQRGTHAHLLEQGGLYKQLYELQFKKDV
jgi:subfamily B ATP-binding cassette protein MsbA